MTDEIWLVVAVMVMLVAIGGVTAAKRMHRRAERKGEAPTSEPLPPRDEIG